MHTSRKLLDRLVERDTSNGWTRHLIGGTLLAAAGLGSEAGAAFAYDETIYITRVDRRGGPLRGPRAASRAAAAAS